MTLPIPDLVVPIRIGPGRSARLADWLDDRSEFDVLHRPDRSLMGIKVETSSCRNLIIRTDEPIGTEDAVDLLKRTLRRVSTHKVKKECQTRILSDLSSIADLATAEWIDEKPWNMVARTATPFGKGGVIGWSRSTGPRGPRFGIIPKDWSWDPPMILCIHGDKDVTLVHGQANANQHDDPMSLMRSLARARAMIDDPQNNPWILPTDETPR